MVRVGVVGVGALALRGIIPHLTQDDVRDRVRVQALCDPVLERARSTGERYGIERSYGAFYRRFALPDTADAEGISAQGKNGVLEISIPKKAEAAPRRIEIKH